MELNQKLNCHKEINKDDLGVMVTTVDYEQVVKIGDEIEFMVKDGKRKGRHALIVIKAPKRLKIERTNRYTIQTKGNKNITKGNFND